MKKYFLAFLILFSVSMSFGQPAKKPAKQNVPSQSEIDKMMKEAMKDLSADEKKLVQESMKASMKMQEKGMPESMNSQVIGIPKKQVEILRSIPTFSDQQQYNAYLASLLATCKKNIAPAVIAEVDKFFSKNASDLETLANSGPFLILKQKPDAAVYAAIKIAITKPAEILLQDNLAVILHQAGYPHKALPILIYLSHHTEHPIILNNIAQSYLSLGDTSNARKFFLACLRMDPNHCEANCGIGLMLTQAGKTHDAEPYIIKSLKNGYTETADALARQNKIHLRFSDIKSNVPEYFNPQKYKPVSPAAEMSAVEPTEALRSEMEATMRFWSEKNERVQAEQEEKIQTESATQLMDRSKGFLGKTALAKKAKLMVDLLGVEHGEFIGKDQKNYYLAINKSLNEQLQKKLTEMYGGNQHYENEYQECQKKIEILNNHLNLTAQNHGAYQRATLPEVYDWVNQSLFWWSFLMNKDQYKVYFHYLVNDFFHSMHEYDQMQTLYPTPLWISKTCKNVKAPDVVAVKKPIIDSLEPHDCPVKLEVPFGVGKGKLDCDGFEIEGGELIMLGFERKFDTGEMTFFLGLGAEFFGKAVGIGGAEGGGKIGSFIKVGRDGSILDIGNKGEVGVEGGIGPFMMEQKITGVMGMESGIKITRTGEDKPIFEYGTK